LVICCLLMASQELSTALLISTTITAALNGEAGTNFRFGGFKVDFTDVVCIGLILRTLAHPPTPSTFRNSKAIYWLLFALTALFTIGYCRGLSVVSLKQVTNESRRIIFAMSVTWYIASLPPNKEVAIRLTKVGFLFAIALMFIAAARYLHLIPQPQNLSDPTLEVSRLLPSQNACFMASCLILMWGLLAEGRLERQWKWMLIALPIFVVILQHRSVWIQMIVMMCVCAIGERRFRKWTVAWCSIGLAAALAMAVFAPSSGLAQSLVTSVRTTSGEHSTANWREEGWKQLLAPKFIGDTENYVIGKPAGTGFLRYIRGLPIDAEPHNCFVLIILRAGYLGLAIFILMCLLLLWHLWMRGSFGRALAVSVMGLLGYFVAYSFDEPQAFIIGLALYYLRCVPATESESVLASLRRSLFGRPHSPLLPRALSPFPRTVVVAEASE